MDILLLFDKYCCTAVLTCEALYNSKCRTPCSDKHLIAAYPHCPDDPECIDIEKYCSCNGHPCCSTQHGCLELRLQDSGCTAGQLQLSSSLGVFLLLHHELGERLLRV
jgi:hypothetical protein